MKQLGSSSSSSEGRRNASKGGEPASGRGEAEDGAGEEGDGGETIKGEGEDGEGAISADRPAEVSQTHKKTRVQRQNN